MYQNMQTSLGRWRLAGHQCRNILMRSTLGSLLAGARAFALDELFAHSLNRGIQCRSNSTLYVLPLLREGLGPGHVF